jgi:hypothetical protein
MQPPPRTEGERGYAAKLADSNNRKDKRGAHAGKRKEMLLEAAIIALRLTTGCVPASLRFTLQ